MICGLSCYAACGIFLFICFIFLIKFLSHSVVSDSLWSHRLQPTRLLCPWNSPGQHAGVGSHSLLQGIFLTQGWNLGLLHCRHILYRLSQEGSPCTKDQTLVPCIGRLILIFCATREVLKYIFLKKKTFIMYFTPFLFFSGFAVWLLVSWFPHQGLNPWQWKHRVLTPGPPGNSHNFFIVKFINFFFYGFLSIFFFSVTSKNSLSNPKSRKFSPMFFLKVL